MIEKKNEAITILKLFLKLKLAFVRVIGITLLVIIGAIMFLSPTLLVIFVGTSASLLSIILFWLLINITSAKLYINEWKNLETKELIKIEAGITAVSIVLWLLLLLVGKLILKMV